jgi:hypothetical protein
MLKNCEHCNKQFEIGKEDKDFYSRISPVINGEKFNIPEPKDCPSCRRERLLAFWPYGILQKRKCDFSGETIISTYGKDCHFPVYKREYWFSDKWNPPSQDIDFNRSFFDQLYELQCKTPHFHQLGKNSENCDYADDVWDCKNCYLSRSVANSEEMYYVYRIIGSKNCLDITYCYNMEQCYECVYCWDGFNLMYALDCRNCSDSWFLYNCRGCNDCFMSWNLRNKKYHILNKQYSKEEYFGKLAEFNLSSRKSLLKLREEFYRHVREDACHKQDFNLNNQNSTGNYISNCKNCNEAYFLENSEDCSHVIRSPWLKDSQDVAGLLRGELCYQICQSTNLNNVKFGNFSVDCHDCMYIDQCFNSSNLFGCVGLKRREYCILNKQYSKEEYEKLVPKIIGNMGSEWGAALPYKFAYNGFNFSLGFFYYTETEASMKIKGGFFETEPENAAQGIDAKTLPDSSNEIDDSIIGKPISCAETGKIYTFIKQELDFYRRHNLPLPLYYPERRNLERFGQLVPLSGRGSTCSRCGSVIITYYPESWQYMTILCEKCYLGEVY